MAALHDAIRALPVMPPGAVLGPARFALVAGEAQDALALQRAVTAELAEFGVRTRPLSALDHATVLLEVPGRAFMGDDAAAFEAAYALAAAFGLRAAEPDLATPFFPDDTPVRDGKDPVQEGVSDLLGCWAPAEPGLASDWALDAMRVQDAWAFSEAKQRPSRGEGVIVAQPDTGVTNHLELAGVIRAGGFDVLDHDPDPTDPLTGSGNPGHGTATASVLLSPPAGSVTGTAPRARHMPIRAIESVVRVTQVSVAEAMDWAVAHGAAVITMSLGGIPSFSLHRALLRAVAADVIVLAAAGNCVHTVVWPARYDDCIAVAGTAANDEPWQGSCRGAAVDISAPGQNVTRARVVSGSPGDVGQGQGTSFAVALTAGVAALWLAHHGRANLVAAARARGETLQGMFRRMLRATARRPAGWNSFDYGAGVVDARALLEADLDLGRELEAAEVMMPPAERSAATVASLAAEVHPETALAEMDWSRFGPEAAARLLRQQLDPPGRTLESVVGAPPPSAALDAAVANPALRRALGLGDGMTGEVLHEGGVA